MRTRKTVASSIFAASTLLSGAAFAQEPSPFDQPQAPPAQPAPAPGQWGQPQPGAPPPGQPGAAPGAWGQPQPGAPPAGGQPGAPGQFGGEGQFGAGASFDASGGTGQWGAQGAAGGDDGREDGDSDWEERERSLINQNNLLGSTGLLRTSFAGSGAEGTFRIGFITDWFTTSNFLCQPGEATDGGVEKNCAPGGPEDEASHIGGFFSINATPLSFLEGYAQLRTYANSNSEGRPQLLQVLGDTTFGAKGFTPDKLAGFLTLGGELQLFLLNGTGAVGPAGGGTSAAIRALSTADFRKPGGKGFPLRANLNLGYKIDNSGEVVLDVEEARAAALGRERAPISRVERFGLGINKVDQFQTYLGVEVPFDFIQPFLEYTIDIPVNRQGYECFSGSVSRGDVCLGLTDLGNANGDAAGFSYVPSRLSIGVRATPFEDKFRGLSGLLAFDIGTTGTSDFVEEVAPQAPWTMYFGIGFAYDVWEKPQEVVERPAPAPVVQEAPKVYVRGFVRERGKQEGVPGAIVSFQGGAQPPLATGADGRFLSRDLAPGQYTFEIAAPGFKPGVCVAVVQPSAPPPPAMMPPAQPAPPPGQLSPPPGQFVPPPPPPAGPTFVDIDCEIDSLPRNGNVLGGIKDAATGSSVSGAVVKATDALGKESSVTADGTGSFRLDGMPPGEVTLRATADGYMTSVTTVEVRASEDAKTTLSLNKRPKNQKVKIQGNEIRLSEKILFETDSAKILGQSSALLEEIADVFQRNPNITLVEIQGHTDNSGARDHNQRLSDARANSVRDYLTKSGVASSRMTAKGYGQDRPVSPNVTEANKAKNRRVQFIILKK